MRTDQDRGWARAGRGRSVLVTLLAAAVATVVGALPGAPAAAIGETAAVAEYRPFRLELNATGSGLPEASGCSAEYGASNQRCEGRYQRPDGTWPFSHDVHGTSVVGRVEAGGGFPLTFHVVGARLDGHVPSESSDRYTVTGAAVPWGTGVHTPDLPGVAAGQQGGPLRLTVDGRCNLLGCYYRLALDGWLLVTPVLAPGVGVPSPTSSTSTTAGPVAPVAVVPRFTG